MTTIREIAELCGVSVATVSRVFNRPLTVSREKREAVERVARELDYRPNESARALASRRSALIGLVWDTDHRRPGWRHPYLQELLVGLKTALSGHGYHLLMLATSGTAALRSVGASLADPVAYVNMTRRHHLGGLVLIDSGSDGPAFAAFAQSGLPCVAVDVAVEGDRATYVTSDNAGGAESAVRHLVASGHRRIATIAGPAGNRPATDRLAGFHAAMAAAGLPVPAEHVVVGDFHRPSGQDAMRRLIALPEPPTAVVCASDEMAVGALLAARHAGLRVPDDVALVGFDDIELAGLVDPPLTTVAQDKSGIGAAAARAVLTMVHDGRTPPPAVLPTRLVVRASSRPR